MQNLESTDWVRERGAAWAANLLDMEATLRPVDAPLLDALRLDRAYRIADVGSGGGGTSIHLGAVAPVGSVVRGFDIAPQLVAIARERVAEGDSVVAFEEADASRTVPTDRFDRLVSRFGVMFFDDDRGAFANLARWLVPDGRFAFAVWGSPADNPWIARVREIVAGVVPLPKPDPDAPGPFRYADSGKLVRLLESSGFSAVESTPWRGSLPIGGRMPPPSAARFALTSFSTFAQAIADSGDPTAFDRAHEGVTRCFEGFFADGAVRMDTLVHVVSGSRAL